MIQHRTECPSPDLHHFHGSAGDVMERCRNCGRVRPLDADEATGLDVAPLSLEKRPMPTPDRHTNRQANRHGDSWPTHRARRRSRDKRLRDRERKAA